MRNPAIGRTEKMEMMNDLQKVAQQLRKPAGEFGEQIALKMDEVNRPLYDLVLNTLAPENGDTILEIGFGGGGHFETMLKSNPHTRIYGIDYSEKMVAMAKQQNRTGLASGRLVLKYGDSRELPFDSGSFDTVFCNMVIYFWENPAHHLQEIHRVLKPQGKFLTGFRPRRSMTQFPFTQYGFRLYDTDEWSSILESHGFATQHVTSADDPPIHEDGGTIQLESKCIVSHKAP